MIRLIAIAAFALAVTTSAEAMSPAPLHQADGMITQVRQACGAGMKWNNALGRCATTSARRNVRRGVPIIEKWITNPMYPAAPTIKSQSVHAII